MLKLPGLPKTLGAPMSNQVTPPFDVAKTLPVYELMTISLPSIGLTAKLAMPFERPLRIGSGQTVATPAADRTFCRVPLAWKKFGEIATGAGRNQY